MRASRRSSRLLRLLAVPILLAVGSVLIPGGSALAWTNPTPVPISSHVFGGSITAANNWVPRDAQSVRLWDDATRWSNLEPKRGVYNWQWLDGLVSRNLAANKKIMLTFGGTPAWTSIDPHNTHCAFYDKSKPTTPGYTAGQCESPRSYADWDNFVRAVVTHYRGKIESYELWNEVNNPTMWAGRMDTMARMSNDAATIIHSVDSKAIAVSPSVLYVQNPSNVDAMLAMVRAGGFRHINAVGVHLYWYGGQQTPELNANAVVAMQARLAAAGVRAPVWNTENAWGYNGDTRRAPQTEENITARNWLVQDYLHIPRQFYYSQNTYMPWEQSGSPAWTAVQQLKSWYRGAAIQGCGRGVGAGLPFDIWQCTFYYGQVSGGYSYAQVRWSAAAPYREYAPTGTRSVQYLDGPNYDVHAGTSLTVSQRPVLTRFVSATAPSRLVTAAPTYLGPATKSLIPAPSTISLSLPTAVKASSVATATASVTRSDLHTAVPGAKIQFCRYSTTSSCSVYYTNSAGKAYFPFRANYATSVEVFGQDLSVTAAPIKKRMNVYSLLKLTGGYHKLTYSVFPTVHQTYWVQRWTGSSWSSVRTGSVTTSATQSMTAIPGTYRIAAGSSSWTTFTYGPQAKVS